MPVIVDFDNGVAGEPILVGGNITQVVNDPVYTATAAHGPLAMQCTGNNQQIRVNFTDGVEHSGSIYFRSATVPSSRIRLVNIATSSNSVICAIGIHSDGKIDLSDGSSRYIATVVSWSPDTWHRLDWQFVQATKTMRVRFYATAEAQRHDDQIEASFADNPTTPARWNIGGLSSGEGTTIQVDTLRAEAGLHWLGPYGTPVTQAGSVVHHWVGAPATDGFRVTSKTAAATSLRLVVATNSTATENLQMFGPSSPDDHGYVSFAPTGLSLNQTYYYQLEDTPNGGSPIRIGPIGTAKTLPAVGYANFSFGFGNCVSNANQGMEAYTEILSQNPLFFMHLGDFHYRDSSSLDINIHRWNLERQIADVSGVRTLIQNIPTYYIRSDHDGGGSDNEDPGPWYVTNQDATKWVAPMPELANQPTEALYFSWVVGRVRFIALDVRNTYRTPGGDAQSPAKTMLGAQQKQWLKDRLLDPEPVKIVFSDTPWIGYPGGSLAHGEDKWWAYDDERTEIGDFISSNNVKALMITGDLHSIYADDGTNNQWGNFPIIGAGPLANSGGFRGGPYQQLWTPGEQARAWGYCEVTDTGTNLTVAFVGRDALNDLDRATLTTEWTFDYTWSEWDGTQEVPLTLDGVWDGNSAQPVDVDQVT